MDRCVLIVHGGAWAIPENKIDASLEGVEAAAREGWKQLMQGASAVKAVQAAVNALEDDPVFDAGYGSVLTDSGEVEMDALIMDGKRMRSGAVGAVSCVKNPVDLARHVMENTDHTLLVGKGAERQATLAGLEIVEPESLVTPEGREEWETYKQYKSAVNSLFSGRDKEKVKAPEPGIGHDTVGCVALDAEGNIACATSTGGITGKMPGRVGDTPLVGAGGYADNQVGGVSTTGHGESITKTCLAHTAVINMEQGLSPSGAGKKALERMMDKVGGAGGLIIINKSGEWTAEFSTERMAWAAIKEDTLYSGIHPGQVNQNSL